MSNVMNWPDDDIYGMAVKRVGMLAVSVRKMKALTVKMEKVTVIHKGRENVTKFVY
jgi:hypothetical protein